MCPVTSSAYPTSRRAPSSAAYGVELTFETLLPTPGADVPERMCPEHDSLIRVIAGTVSLTVDGVERLLGTGDEAIVRAGAPHRLACAGGEARFLTGYRSARR